MPSVTSSPTPRHIAIIMDGNRRWASKRGLPSAVGHANGARRVHKLVEGCFERGISYLTLFAFSTENWRRPPDEVTGLMGLFALYLQKEISNMNAKGQNSAWSKWVSLLHPPIEIIELSPSQAS